MGRADLVGLQIHTFPQKFCFPMPGNGQGQAWISAGEKDLEKLAVQGRSEPEVTGAWLPCSLAGLKNNCILHAAPQLVTTEGRHAGL